MKKLLFYIAFILASVSSYADGEKKVKLDDDHSKELVQLGFCNIFVTKVGVDDDGHARVGIEIENLDESLVILLFGHAYPEKSLKRLSPSIVYDKKFQGTKGTRKIETCKGNRDVMIIEPSDKYKLTELLVPDSETQLCRLPFYFAKYKNWKKRKMILMERETIDLIVEAEVKPDENFVRLEKESDELIAKIAKKTYCTNPKHSPSLEGQKKQDKEKINKIKEEIDGIIAQKNWQVGDRGYQRYDEIRKKLDAVAFPERDCGKHRIVPGCKYCNLTPKQIYNKLDDCYKKIYNSNDRKATKNAVMSDVNLLYGCSKHSSSWKNSSYSSKITDRYNRISNF